MECNLDLIYHRFNLNYLTKLIVENIKRNAQTKSTTNKFNNLLLLSRLLLETLTDQKLFSDSFKILEKEF